MPAPGLTEIATTTLRNRSTKVPSTSPKMRKTMSAIAHGWKPTGEAAKIPISVAKEFHAADAGKKYGAKKHYDRSSHQPGNPGFNREGKPAPAPFNGGAHAIQPKGHPIGNAPEMAHHTRNQTFAQEVTEHHGQQKGAPMGSDRGKVGNIDAKHGSALVEDCGDGHASQPQGHSIGAGRSTPRMITGHGFGHAAPQRSGALRMSGHPGAHRIGRR